jgi:hypothetical protein
MSTLRRVKGLRKACSHLEKLRISHEWPNIKFSELKSMFRDVPYLELITDGYIFSTKI